MELDVRVLEGAECAQPLDGPVDIQMGERRIIVHVLENGMNSGAPSVSLSVRKDDGTWFLFEMSARLFCAAAGVVRGASQRFGYDL